MQEFFKKHVIPLVGHRKPSNDAKRYTKRPLVVVYYGVDFSFDYRKGECLIMSCCPNAVYGTCYLEACSHNADMGRCKGGSLDDMQCINKPFFSLLATQFWRSKVLDVAKDYPEYTFAIADEEDFADELKSLGLSESGEEVNVGILADGGKKYAMEPEEFDSEVLRDFVKAFKKGE